MLHRIFEVFQEVNGLLGLISLGRIVFEAALCMDSLNPSL